MNKYPTLEEVRAADHRQLGMWYRFLPSPGSSAIDTEQFSNSLRAEARVMDLICNRLKTLGGMTPEISRTIGW